MQTFGGVLHGEGINFPYIGAQTQTPVLPYKSIISHLPNCCAHLSLCDTWIIAVISLSPLTSGVVTFLLALVLFWKFHPHDKIWVLLVTLALLALGTSGYKILQDALRDLVTDVDESSDLDETRSNVRATIWYRVAYMLGFVLAIFVWVFLEFDSSWKSAIFICIITMTLAVIISGFGHLRILGYFFIHYLFSDYI
ncbi:putative MFS transporter superfamily [Helianthus anomalus]